MILYMVIRNMVIRDEIFLLLNFYFCRKNVLAMKVVLFYVRRLILVAKCFNNK